MGLIIKNGKVKFSTKASPLELHMGLSRLQVLEKVVEADLTNSSADVTLSSGFFPDGALVLGLAVEVMRRVTLSAGSDRTSFNATDGTAIYGTIAIGADDFVDAGEKAAPKDGTVASPKQHIAAADLHITLTGGTVGTTATSGDAGRVRVRMWYVLITA